MKFGNTSANHLIRSGTSIVHYLAIQDILINMESFSTQNYESEKQIILHGHGRYEA
jgi:hypothetical protein